MIWHVPVLACSSCNLNEDTFKAFYILPLFLTIDYEKEWDLFIFLDTGGDYEVWVGPGVFF